MMWNGLLINKVLDLCVVVSPKAVWGKVQSKFVILMLVNVLFLFINKACAGEEDLAIEMPKSHSLW